MATEKTSENFLRSGEVSFKGFIAGLAESKDKYNRHKSMVLYGPTFVISAYRTGEKLLVKQEFNIDELTKARRFYRSIRFFKNHTTWLQE
ncbi:MAG TPA: hypothetical protein DHV48_18945 [Prolixibacteraceae bacterium]|nr:hypothetical protein [Prolixibacteraceae bacterium]